MKQQLPLTEKTIETVVRDIIEEHDKLIDSNNGIYILLKKRKKRFLKRTDENEWAPSYKWTNRRTAEALLEVYAQLKKARIYHPETEFSVGRGEGERANLHAIAVHMPWLKINYIHIASEHQEEWRRKRRTARELSQAKGNVLPYHCNTIDIKAKRNWGVCPELQEIFYHDLHIS